MNTFLNWTFGGKCESWIRLSNYAIKADLKTATGVDTSKFAKKVDLVKQKKLENDKLDIGKLGTTPVDLSDVVKN